MKKLLKILTIMQKPERRGCRLPTAYCRLLLLLLPTVYCLLPTSSIAQPTLMWAKHMGGAGWDEGYSIVVDDSGNVLTTGVFASIVDFDPGASIFTLTSAGNWDIFVSKLDLSGNKRRRSRQ